MAHPGGLPHSGPDAVGPGGQTRGRATGGHRPEDKQSIEVFKLTVALYPTSANTYDSLAEAYETTGDKRRAIANYARSLELDPKNGNTVEHLAKLRGTSPSLKN